MIAPPPPSACARLDFETYSEAGHVWDGARWRPPRGAQKKGLSAVGIAAYAEHPTTEILCLAYRLPGGQVKHWWPGMPAPTDLFDWVRSGGLMRAHNVMVERLIWELLCVPMGFPPVAPDRWRCTMATARVNSYPGALAELGEVLGLDTQKDKDGKRLINKFCVPQNPTKKNPKTRILPADDWPDFLRLVEYCRRDVETEEAAANAMPEMTPDELAFWLIDQEINHRGVKVDMAAVRDMAAVMDQTFAKYDAECQALTGFSPGQNKELLGFLRGLGVYSSSLDAEHVEELLAKPDLPELAKRVLQIKSLTASASVKKLNTVIRSVNRDQRLRNLYMHHGAHTGRPTGDGAQPTNLPKAGPSLKWDSAGWPCGSHLDASPWTGEDLRNAKVGPWSPEAADKTIELMACRSADVIEGWFGDSLLAISGCVRGIFEAAPGYELISSDYTAIEAVVAACASGEQWRIDTFRRGEDIYLASIGQITKTPLSEYAEYRKRTGQHHPDRQRGKIGELASGYGGWVGAWRQFGAEGTDEELKAQILQWRAASPRIVEMWGGQGRGFPGSWNYRPERYGLEGAAVNAIQYPGQVFDCNGCKFYMTGRDLKMRLYSGRELTYHNARLIESDRRAGEFKIIFWRWNTNPKYGAMGWVVTETYGGRLFENFVQAVSHDIQRHGIVNLHRAGYPVVMHTYDEMVSEVPAGFGSVEEYERVMTQLPEYAKNWPIGAAGGWRGRRYRKG